MLLNDGSGSNVVEALLLPADVIVLRVTTYPYSQLGLKALLPAFIPFLLLLGVGDDPRRKPFGDAFYCAI